MILALKGGLEGASRGLEQGGLKSRSGLQGSPKPCSCRFFACALRAKPCDRPQAKVQGFFENSYA